MRKLVILGLVVAVASGAFLWDWWGHQGAEGTVLVAPAAADSRAEALAPYMGRGERLTVVHFWATWCAPCMVEMPHALAGLKAIPKGVRVVMVNLDKPLPDSFYTTWKVDPKTVNPHWVDDPEQALATAALGKVMLPTTLVVVPSPTRIIQQIDGPLNWPTLLKALQ